MSLYLKAKNISSISIPTTRAWVFENGFSVGYGDCDLIYLT